MLDMLVVLLSYWCEECMNVVSTTTRRMERAWPLCLSLRSVVPDDVMAGQQVLIRGPGSGVDPGSQCPALKGEDQREGRGWSQISIARNNQS